MTRVSHVKISKFLSLILRHKPEHIGITLDNSGWADVEDLLEKSKAKGMSFDFDTLCEVVATSDKKRFTFNEDETLIRANQGHSIDVDLGLKPVTPPEKLYHGTATRFRESIQKKGLIKGNRQFVHLSKDIETAGKVGTRHGKLLLLLVDSKQMHTDGLSFYCSKNGVWLCESVPAKYLSLPD